MSTKRTGRRPLVQAAQTVQVGRFAFLKNPDNTILGLGLAAIALLLLGYSMVFVALSALVAIWFAWRSRTAQVGAAIFGLALMLGLMYRQNVLLTEVAKNASVAATTKAPGLVMTVPGLFVFDSLLVFDGQVKSSFETVRRGDILAIGEEAMGLISPGELERGQLGIEPGIKPKPTPQLQIPVKNKGGDKTVK